MKSPWITRLLPGVLLGFTVGRLGFGDYNQLHRMLLFQDLRLLLAFATAASLCMVGFALLKRHLRLPPVRFHRGTLPGAILFGIGWAVTGACPGVAFVQVGQGIGWALITLAGILTGTWLESRLRWGRSAVSAASPPPPASYGCSD